MHVRTKAPNGGAHIIALGQSDKNLLKMHIANVCFGIHDKADFSSDFLILDFSFDFLRSNHLA